LAVIDVATGVSLESIPDWLITVMVNGLVIVGLVGISAAWIARWVPYLIYIADPYNSLASYVWCWACISKVVPMWNVHGVNVWRELEAKIAIAEKQSAEANARLSNQLQANKKLTQEVKNANQAAVRANASKIDAECRVPDVAIELLNSASQNKVSRSSSGAQGTLPKPGTSQPARP
jgi:thiol:disulfide interchange protein